MALIFQNEQVVNGSSAECGIKATSSMFREPKLEDAIQQHLDTIEPHFLRDRD
jgi:hypothetical protein